MSLAPIVRTWEVELKRTARLMRENSLMAPQKRRFKRTIDGFYNPIRQHPSLDFPSPVQFEKRAAE